VEEGLAASDDRECADGGEVACLVGEDERVDANTAFRQLVCCRTPEGVGGSKQRFLLVGARDTLLIAWLELSGANDREAGEEEVDLATEGALGVSTDKGR
jgi:hypothetical protein